MKRREFIRTAGGATAVAAASGTAAASEEGGGGGEVRPDWGGWLDGVDGGYEDHRGEDEVTVEVGASGNGGNLAFSPAGVWVDQGATVVWEWTGEGGAHNVVAEEGPHDVNSGDPVEGSGETYEYTFEEGGITKYVCEPHASLNMQGAVAVGDDVATVETGGGGGAWPESVHDIGVPIQAHWVGAATILGIVVTVIFTFYVLKYGESAHTGTGR